MTTTLPSTSGITATRFDLAGRWSCRAVAGPTPPDIGARLAGGFPANVPGVVHTDLLAAGLIADPFDGDNERTLTWIGRTDWEYSLTFDWPGSGHDRHELVADGLDTVATVRLNDTELGRTANHHRSYRFDVSDILVPGENRLVVRFTSAVDFAAERSAALGQRPHVNAHPYNAVRKPAYSFGWDWGPELVTAGIWGPISIESWSLARLRSVRPVASYGEDGIALLDMHVDVERRHGDDLRVTIAVGTPGSKVHTEAATTVTADHGRLSTPVPGAEPWWPRSHGEQPLYPVVVTLATADGTTLDTWQGRIGFRTVTLDTTADEKGHRFTVRVNGEDVYVRGANWIPDDSFLPRIDRERLARRIGDAVAANMNLLRVWGGGIYESEEFYELCDEQGILVWQDFALACAAYSEDRELADEIEAEARQAVTRLCAHPSLAIWNGGNESVWGYADWGWRQDLQGSTWGEWYYTDLFPRLVEALAPGTPYCPNSPYSFSRYLHPNDAANGTTHIWDVWNTHDYTAYREYRPRFVSEFGFQGPPAFSTLTSAVHDEPLTPSGPQLLAHQKADDGATKLERGLRGHLPVPSDFVDWHWATQLNQARAVRFGVEHFRSLAPVNTGVVVWQLNDCWPVVSWAAVDSCGVRKPLWFALRSAYADRLATIQPRGDRLALVLHNDSDTPWATTARVRRLHVTGTELAGQSLPVRVGARRTSTLLVDGAVCASRDPAAELLVADLGSGERAPWFFVEDPLLRLRADAFTATAEATDTGSLVTVEATGVVKDLTLLVDHVDPAATVDQGLVMLLPGESTTFAVASARELDPRSLISHPVLRSANDLVDRR